MNCSNLNKACTPRLGLPLIGFLLIGLATICSIYLVASYALGTPYAIGYGEGPIVNQAWLLAQGKNIYRPDIAIAPFTIANYPPIYMALQAIIAAAKEEPSFIVGRIISLCSYLLIAWNIFFLVKEKTNDSEAATLGTLLFLANPFSLRWCAQGRIDMLALAFFATGLRLALQKEVGKGSQLSIVVLMSLSILTRQSYIFSSIFCPCALFFMQRKYNLFKTHLIGVGITIFIACISLQLLTDGGFLTHTVKANINNLLPGQLFVAADILVELLPISLILLVYGLAADTKHRNLMIILLVSCTPSLLSIMKVGAVWNYTLELVLALSLCLSLFVSTLKGNKRLLAFFSLFIQLVLILGSEHRNFFLTPYRYWHSQGEGLAQIQSYITTGSKRTLHDNMMGIETLSGGEIYFQPFIMTQLAKQQIWDQRPFVRELKKESFELISIFDYRKPLPRDERWTEEMQAALKEHYFLCKDIGRISILLPKRHSADKPASLGCK